VLPERFCQVIVAFAGDLQETEIEALRTWIEQASIASVWETLGPLFRWGPAALRAGLRHQLKVVGGRAE
jgi:hypothetical protein